MSWYLGPVGALVLLDRVNLGVIAKPDKGAVIHDMPGGRAVDFFGVKRSWVLPARQLTAAQRHILDRLFWLPGPLRLLDTNQVNFLTANQSSGTDALLTTTGFRETAGTIFSSTTQQRSGTNALKWVVASGLAAGNGVWTGASSVSSPVAAVDDLPVLPSRDYTFSFYVRHSTGTVQLRATINWFTALGVAISTSTGTSTSSSTAIFDTSCTLTATSPATAGYARCELEIGTGTPSAIMDIYFDELLFQQASAASAWVLGKGIPIVAATDLDVEEVRQGRANYSLTLLEVA